MGLNTYKGSDIKQKLLQYNSNEMKVIEIVAHGVTEPYIGRYYYNEGADLIEVYGNNPMPGNPMSLDAIKELTIDEGESQP